MDVERALLARVINDQSLPLAVKARITPDFFRDALYRRVYEFLLAHWRKYTEAPNLEVVKRSFPSYDWSPPSQGLDYLIDSMRERRSRTIAVTALEAAARLLNEVDNPEATEQIWQTIGEGLMQMRAETTGSVDTDSTEYSDEVIDLLHWRLENSGVLRGIPTGFAAIDYATGGWQPEQFVVLMGLPKSLKSSLLLYMALRAQKQGQTSLFFSFEMSYQEQLDRLLSLRSGVSLTKILNGTYNPRELKAVKVAYNEHTMDKTLRFSVDIENALTVSGVRAKAIDYTPDIIFIDAAYLMQTEIPGLDPTSPAAMTDVARTLKQLAQSIRIPIVVTVQASQTRAAGGRLNAGSAMYTQAWRQSADVLLGSERASTDEEVLANNGAVAILIKVLASRSGPYAESSIVWDWGSGYVDEQLAVGAMPAQDDAH